MTLAEKIRLCSGKNCWETKAFPQYGIPSVWVSDGPHGLRKQETSGDMLGIHNAIPATCFPAAVSTGCSWDTGLTAAVGRAIAEEAASQGVSTILGPGANIKRNPLCGRNFEYYSEDPYLTGKLAGAFISGVQENGVGTSLKHFAVNNQENKRFSSDSILDERTLREIYLTGFEMAVKESNPSTVMCAYNMLNGTHCSNNKYLLTDILRNEWGFDGMVVTDWGAIFDRIQAFQAGCDLAMPGGAAFMEQEAWDAVKNGTLPEADIDRSVERILKFVSQINTTEKVCDFDAHHALAKRAAAESAVLLKNDGILPLKGEERIVLIGHMAEQMRYQGSGSSHINPFRLTSLTDAMPQVPYVPGCTEKGDSTLDLLEQARLAASEAEVVILVVGLPGYYESEGYDRSSMKMPEGHLQLIDTVTQANPNTVVVLLSGSVVEMPWINQVKAVLYMGLPGEAGGEAIANLLYGIANPCGKLAETWPVVYEDCASASYYGEKDAHYREGIYVGYRYYEKAGKPVRYPFGHGLSYTSFAYSNLRIEGNCVFVDVTNTGNFSGAEIVQLYIAADGTGIHRPLKELKGFAKVWLNPGETKPLSFMLDERSFAIWANGWAVPRGQYRILVGASSQDIRLRLTLPIPGDEIPVPHWQAGSWYETMQGIPSHKEWEEMLGHMVTAPVLKQGQFTMNHAILEMREHSLVMKILYWYIEKMMAKQYGNGKADYTVPEFRMMMCASADCSIPGVINNAVFRNYLLQGTLEIANGHPIRGLCLIVKKLSEPEG